MSDEELTQAMTDAVIFGTGVMQDGKRIDPLSFFVQPVSDPACEHCGMDPAALTEQLEAARADAKEAEAYAEELEKERDYTEGTNEVLRGENQRLEAKLAKVVEGLWWFAEGRFLNSGREPRECLQSVIYKARATLAEIEGEKT